MFFLIAFSIYLGAHVYSASRLISPSRFPRVIKTAFWAAFLMHSLLVPAMFFLRNGGYWPKWLGLYYFAVFTGAGFMAILFPMLVARDALWIAYKLPAIARKTFTKEADDKPANPERRLFFVNTINAGITAATSGMTGLGVYNACRPPAIVEVTMTSQKLPPEFDGFTIAQITDVHLSPTVGADLLNMIVDMVNELGADMVAVTGDMVDGYVNELGETVKSLGRIKSRHGSYFVTGNHEYYWNGPKWVEKFRSIGLTPLINENVVIERNGVGILVAGIPDHSAGRGIPGHSPDLQKALAGAPELDFKLMLAHQPRSVVYTVESGFDMMICGHTHGGQFFPWNLIIPLFHPVPTGFSIYKGMPVYASAGTVYWGPPMRLGTRAEITRITLKREA